MARENTAELEERLKTRWFDLWLRLLPEHPSHDAWVLAQWQRLAAHYNEPHRAYHNLRHISWLLALLDKYRSIVKEPDLVELSIWFHDVIYDVTKNKPEGTPSNEQQSADYAVDVMREAHMSDRPKHIVHSLILVTLHNPKTHPPLSTDEMFLADIDWSPLGWAWPDFTDNGLKIRHEYSEEAGYSQAEFDAGRVAFLKGALKRGEAQFYLPEFKSLYGAQAIYNIERTIRELEAAAA